MDFGSIFLDDCCKNSSLSRFMTYVNQLSTEADPGLANGRGQGRGAKGVGCGEGVFPVEMSGEAPKNVEYKSQIFNLWCINSGSHDSLHLS